MKKIFIIFIIASLTLISISGCKKNESAEEGEETPPANTVYIYDNYFLPATLTVTKPNTVITWVNKGSSNHTVTSGVPNATKDLSKILREVFKSATLAPGVTFKHTFQWEGDWKYYCTFHPQQMTAVIKVKF